MPLCKPCRSIAASLKETLRKVPTHVVHPVDGTPRLYDVHSEAICPDCWAVWRRGTDNVVRLVG